HQPSPEPDPARLSRAGGSPVPPATPNAADADLAALSRRGLRRSRPTARDPQALRLDTRPRPALPRTRLHARLRVARAAAGPRRRSDGGAAAPGGAPVVARRLRR